MRPINYQRIRNATLTFWGYFFFLSIAAFMSVYLFFKSYQVQMTFVEDDIIACKLIQNKQMEVHNRVDSLYTLMDMLNSDKVANDLFLEKYVADRKNDLYKAIGTDSLEFKHYAFLLNGIDRMLMLKDSIRTITDNEHMALKDLTDCINNMRKVQKNLNYDPARNFTIAK